MPPRRLVLSFLALWATLGIVVFVASVQTFLPALNGQAHGPGHVHLALLAAFEAVAAALFLVPKTVRLGGLGLLITFAIAIVAHVAAGEFPSILLLYAVGTIFVLVHGPVPLRWVRARSTGAPAA